MIVKLIICEVNGEQRERFSHSQEAWGELAGVDGFLGQTGGWELANRGRAVVIAFWRDPEVYSRFMSDVHDTIFKAHGQEGSYESISVSLWDQKRSIPGSAGQATDAIEPGRVIQIARCRVKPARQNHFIQVQQEVWSPGMAAAGGMLGGVFTASREDEDRFLVCTLWQSEDNHRNYQEKVLPGLERRAQADRDADSVAGLTVTVEPAWRVPASSNAAPSSC